VDQVCDKDPFCCSGAWDTVCINLSKMLCAASCDTCGDTVCSAAESCLTCAADCGACPAACGNGACEVSESCTTCPYDCGACADPRYNRCGDGSCHAWAGENCSNCAADCGACPAGCGTGGCTGGETCSTCPLDCGPCATPCGDSVCDPFRAESCATCAADCGACVSSCGNGACEAFETAGTCAADCGATACTHSLCAIGAPLVNTCDTCVQTVCDVDSYCCVNGWDATCVWQVQARCGLTCGGVCGDLSCQFNAGETCTTCAADCGPCTGM
jgi:hypothetical protein